MKKKLLFVIPSLEAGGGEKSLINLLHQIDFNSYEVDLFLFNPTGIFIASVPRPVTILELPPSYKTFTKGLFSAVKSFLLQGKITLAIARFLYSYHIKKIDNKAFAEQYVWKYLKKALPIFPKKYTAAIGFLEKSSIYLAVDCVIAEKKIGWIHTNYTTSSMDNKLDNSFFKKLDNLVTVSEECAAALAVNFTDLKSKIKIIYNIVSPVTIKKLALEPTETYFNPEKINLVTIARLSHEKGIDLAVEAMKILMTRNQNVVWYCIGDGIEKEALQQKVTEYNLQDNFIFLGLQLNPYPYLARADIYIQPSRYEGKSIAVDEAKILQKPIIITNFTTAKDQISDQQTGLIVAINPESIADGISKLILDKKLQDSFKNNLSHEKLGTEDEVKKLYTIINGNS